MRRAHPATGQRFGGLGGCHGRQCGRRASRSPSPKRTTTRLKNCSAISRRPIRRRTSTALRAKVTPEMLSYFSEQLAQNASRGLINRVTDVKLLQGDLAEAWREDNAEYATVAMRFALTDSMVERASGRTVEGGTQARSPNCGPSCAREAAAGCSRRSSRAESSACAGDADAEPVAQAVSSWRLRRSSLSADRRPAWRGFGGGEAEWRSARRPASACATSRGRSAARRRCSSAAKENGRGGCWNPARRCGRRYRKHRTPRSRAVFRRSAPPRRCNARAVARALRFSLIIVPRCCAGLGEPL